MSISSDILKNDSSNFLLDEDDDETKPILQDYNHEAAFSTKGIRVLLVDADQDSLLFMNNLLTNFFYQVTNYKNGEEAINFLKMCKDEIALVIWDDNVPEINVHEALNTISKGMDLPIVIMSHEHEIESVKKSILCGAYDFLVKPVSKEVIAVLWQHVFRKKISKTGVDSYSIESDPNEDFGQSNEEDSKNSLEEDNQKSSSKKPRMQWTNDLHNVFVLAVQKCGNVENAVPKQILKIMQEDHNVDGLTRNNVASHLQKYRQNAVKKTHVPPPTTQEDYPWNDAGSNIALTASKPILNPNFDARPMYQTQFTSNNFPVSNNMFMTNPLPSRSSHTNSLPNRYSHIIDSLPNQSSFIDTLPNRSSCIDSLPNRSSFIDTLPNRSSCIDSLPNQASYNQYYPVKQQQQQQQDYYKDPFYPGKQQQEQHQEFPYSSMATTIKQDPGLFSSAVDITDDGLIYAPPYINDPADFFPKDFGNLDGSPI